MASPVNAVMDERVVQTWALHYLHSRYAKMNPQSRIFADVEMRLKKQSVEKKGNDRVDGLICIDKAEGTHTVAIEAKSMKTVYSLFELLEPKPATATELMLLLIFVVGLPVLSITILRSITWYWLSAIVIGELALVAVIYGIYTYAPASSKTSVHEQLNKYSGNEKWLALPSQAQNKLSENGTWRRFVKICQGYGYGLVTVREDGFVTEVQVPTRIFKGDFIAHYTNESVISDVLNGRAAHNLNYAGCFTKSFTDKNFRIACKNPLAAVAIP